MWCWKNTRQKISSRIWVLDFESADQSRGFGKESTETYLSWLRSSFYVLKYTRRINYQFHQPMDIVWINLCIHSNGNCWCLPSRATPQWNVKSKTQILKCINKAILWQGLFLVNDTIKKSQTLPNFCSFWNGRTQYIY